MLSEEVTDFVCLVEGYYNVYCNTGNTLLTSGHPESLDHQDHEGIPIQLFLAEYNKWKKQQLTCLHLTVIL
jgi:hypothetical protein